MGLSAHRREEPQRFVKIENLGEVFDDRRRRILWSEMWADIFQSVPGQDVDQRAECRTANPSASGLQLLDELRDGRRKLVLCHESLGFNNDVLFWVRETGN